MGGTVDGRDVEVIGVWEGGLAEWAGGASGA